MCSMYPHTTNTCTEAIHVLRVCYIHPIKGTPDPHHKYQFEIDTHNESSETRSFKYSFETY